MLPQKKSTKKIQIIWKEWNKTIWSWFASILIMIYVIFN